MNFNNQRNPLRWTKADNKIKPSLCDGSGSEPKETQKRLDKNLMNTV